MPKLVVITPKQLVKLLDSLGFEQRDAQGSHVLFHHADGRTTTVAMKSREISRGLLRKVLRDIDLSVEAYDTLHKDL